MCRGTAQSSHVLDHDVGGPEFVDGAGELQPQPGTRTVHEPGHAAGEGYVLTREAAREDVHVLDVAPRDMADVSEVGHVGVVVGEYRAGAGVDVGHPGEAAAEHLAHGHVQAAVAAEE
jgi:hypothetical protein